MNDTLAIDPNWGTLFVSVCTGIATLSAAGLAIVTARKAAAKAAEIHVLVNSNLMAVRRWLGLAIGCVVALVVFGAAMLTRDRNRKGK